MEKNIMMFLYKKDLTDMKYQELSKCLSHFSSSPAFSSIHKPVVHSTLIFW